MPVDSNTRSDSVGWRSIDTAPKDGRGVMLIDMSAPKPEAGTGWFVFDVWTAVQPIAALALDREVFEAMVWVSPTHWMPLPTPPALEERRG